MKRDTKFPEDLYSCYNEDIGRVVPVLERPKIPKGITEAWIETYTGKMFHVLNPKVSEVDIEDIAHALSLQCRFGGHTKEFLSIAEHSVLVSHLTESLEGLLHDATEAYIADVVSPLKHHLKEYKVVEKRIQKVIAKKFNLKYPFDPVVKEADIAQLKVEAYYGLANRGESWTNQWESPIKGIEPEFLIPKIAKRAFLNRFKELS